MSLRSESMREIESLRVSRRKRGRSSRSSSTRFFLYHPRLLYIMLTDKCFRISRILDKAHESLSILIALRTSSPTSASSHPPSSTHVQPASNVPSRLKTNGTSSSSSTSNQQSSHQSHLHSQSASASSSSRTSPVPPHASSNASSSSSTVSKEGKNKKKDASNSGGGQGMVLPLAPGRKVAFRTPTKGDEKGKEDLGDGQGWILAVVKRCLNVEKNRLVQRVSCSQR